MRIYVAGPMTGYANDNAPAFAEAARFLRSLGHDVVTPVELNKLVWARHNHDEYDPAVHKIGYGDPILDEMYAEDMKAVCTRDAVALLPGFEKSRGGLGELHVAQILGKQLLDATTGEPMVVTAEWRVIEASLALEPRGFLMGV